MAVEPVNSFYVCTCMRAAACAFGEVLLAARTAFIKESGSQVHFLSKQ